MKPGGPSITQVAGGTTFEIDGAAQSVDVTVQNLMRQALGTTDGTSEDPEGVRLFDDLPRTLIVRGRTPELGLVRLAHVWEDPA